MGARYCLPPSQGLALHGRAELGGGKHQSELFLILQEGTLMGPFPKPERLVTSSISQPDSWGSPSVLWAADTLAADHPLIQMPLPPPFWHQGKGRRDPRLATRAEGGGDLL